MYNNILEGCACIEKSMEVEVLKSSRFALFYTALIHHAI